MAKRMIIVVFLLLLAIGVSIAIPTVQAHAEEPETVSEEPSAETTTEPVEPLPDGEVDGDGHFDTMEWLKKELLPDAVSAIIMFLTMWISTRPQALNNNALAQKMTDYSQTMGVDKETTKKQINGIMNKYELLKSQFENAVGVIEAYKNDIQNLMAQNRALAEAIALGFGNNAELVKKGTAEKIYKLLETAKTEQSAEVTKDDEEVA